MESVNKTILTPEEEQKKKRQENLAKAREARGNKEQKENTKEVKVTNIVEKTKTKTEEPEDKVMAFEIDPNVTYEFIRLDGYTNPKHIQPEAVIWCEATNQKRKIRLAKLEKSPYEDEQSDLAVTENSIIIKGSSFFVDGTEEFKIRYLLAHDSNADKKMTDSSNLPYKGLYKLRDIGAEQKAKIDKEEKIIDAKIIIKQATDEELDTFLRSTLGVGKGVEKDFLRTKAYSLAEIIPDEFLTKFKDPSNKIRVAYQKLVEDGTVIEKEGEVILKSSGEVIYRYTNKVGRVDNDITKFILTDSKEAKTLKTILGL